MSTLTHHVSDGTAGAPSLELQKKKKKKDKCLYDGCSVCGVVVIHRNSLCLKKKHVESRRNRYLSETERERKGKSRTE